MKRQYLVEIDSEMDNGLDEKELLKAVLGGFCDGFYEGKAEFTIREIVSLNSVWKKIEGTDKWRCYTV